MLTYNNQTLTITRIFIIKSFFSVKNSNKNIVVPFCAFTFTANITKQIRAFFPLAFFVPQSF